jgi:adenosylcobyric acid synthase
VTSVGGGVLVAGTSSDAGKSTLVAGLCRYLRNQGIRVAPFKAQNMSLNSFVTADGAEIARSQVMQAAASGIEPTADMNPILLKPGSDRRSQVIVRGHAITEADALDYRHLARDLKQIALESLERLRARYDVVICEGAGSPAEINLRATDIANMGLARAANLPVVLVGDIDRGGVFASMYGTLALLDPEDQALISGFVINKFRGAPELLESGLTMLTQRTGRPFYGVLPWTAGLNLDAEDSLALESPRRENGSRLTVAVVRFPRISNFTDIEALAAEPGVRVVFTETTADLDTADLVILPGTRATVADLRWLRDRGLDVAITSRTRPVLGICGGYQMLGQIITDNVESREGVIEGLGILPLRVSFEADKHLARPVGTAYGETVYGYEIRHGVVERGGGVEPFLADGCRAGAVWGTSWHGTLENDGFRRAFLTEVAQLAGRDFVPAPDTSFAALREARLDLLGDLVAEHLDTAAVRDLIERGAPKGLPAVPRALDSWHDSAGHVKCRSAGFGHRHCRCAAQVPRRDHGHGEAAGRRAQLPALPGDVVAWAAQLQPAGAELPEPSVPAVRRRAVEGDGRPCHVRGEQGSGLCVLHSTLLHVRAAAWCG